MTSKDIFLKIANEVCYGFEVTEETRDFYNMLYFYWVRSEKFTENGFDLEKGIYVFSEIAGNGKTIGMSILQRLLNHTKSPYKFKKTAMRDLVIDYKKNGHDSLMIFTKDNWYIDDFGCEEEKFIDYGNQINLGQVLVNFLYPRFCQGQIFHFSSNLSREKIIETYDERVVSRLFLMANRYHFTGQEMRSKAKLKPKSDELEIDVHEPIILTDKQKERIKIQIEEMKKMFSVNRAEIEKPVLVDYKGQWLDNIKSVAPTLTKSEITETVKVLEDQIEINGKAVDKESILEAIKILQDAKP